MNTLLRVLMHSSNPSQALQLISRARHAIEQRRPKEAFTLLYQAELAHHAPGNRPPPIGEDRDLMDAWRAFHDILPEVS